MKSFIQLNEQINDDQLSDAMFTLTSTLIVLAKKIQTYHHNIIGKNFVPIHKELGDEYEVVNDYIDLTAESVRQINDMPAVTNLKQALNRSLVQEDDNARLVTSETFIPILIQDYKTVSEFCDYINNVSKRPEVSDIAIKIKADLSKFIWFLKSTNK